MRKARWLGPKDNSVQEIREVLDVEQRGTGMAMIEFASFA